MKVGDLVMVKHDHAKVGIITEVMIARVYFTLMSGKKVWEYRESLEVISESR